MKNLSWDIQAWDDYLYWQKTDKPKLIRINRIIKDILRHPTKGIGKLVRLKVDLSGYHSRRIDEENRIVYKIHKDRIHIIQCRFHY